jgi:hypothetical protein
MISNFYNTTATNYRRAYGEDNKTARTEVGEFSCHIQDIDQEESESIGMRFMKGKALWCDEDTDIKKGDEVEVSDDKYKVAGILKRDYGNNQHLKVFIELYES